MPRYFCSHCFYKIYGNEREIVEVADGYFQCAECGYIGPVVVRSKMTEYGQEAFSQRMRDYDNKVFDYNRRMEESAREAERINNMW